MALELKINSPVCNSTVTYEWPLKKSKDYDAAAEIVETVKFVCRDHEDLELLTEQQWFKEVDSNNFLSMKSFCDSYNKAVNSMKALLKGTTKLEQKLNEWASPDALHQIIQQVYNRSVTDPERLNQYEPFSPEVYGETSYDLIKKMIVETHPTEKDIFLDLGSGVGQVVLQMAAGSKCRECFGIEKAETPSEFAKTMDEEFRKWMRWYGKKCSPFHLIKGDFLDESSKSYIQRATIIFVNNYAFGPEVDHQLKLTFAELQEGVRIISSKPFCPLNFRITDRNLTDIGCVMRVKELTPHKGNVSWTCNGVTYYLHTVDRTLLQHYYDEKSELMKSEDTRRSRSHGGSSKSSSNDSSGSNSREGSVCKVVPTFDDEETIPMGPTTRRQWNEWIAKKEVGVPPTKEPVLKVNKPPKESSVGRIQSPSTNPKSHSTASMRSSSRGSANSDHIVLSVAPSSRPTKSSVTSSSDASNPERRKPGRPKSKSRSEIHATATKRKYQMQTKNKVGRPSIAGSGGSGAPSKQKDYMSALDMLHQQTLFSSTQLYEGPPKGCNDVNLSSLKSPPVVLQQPQISPEQREEVDALDVYLAGHRSLMIAFMRQFHQPEYRQYLVECCEKEMAKNKNLLLRQEQLSRQINHLQEEGLDLLKDRISDLGLLAASPAELLNKAKEIVLHHKELQTKVNVLQLEVSGLEQQNQMYLTYIEDKDKELMTNGMLQSLGYPECQNAREAKESILREISSALTHKRALLHECVRMETEISTMMTNIPTDRAVEAILANRQITLEAALSSPIVPTFVPTSMGGETFLSSTPIAQSAAPPMKVESPNVFQFTSGTTPMVTTVTTTSKRGRQSSGKTGRSPRRGKVVAPPARLDGSQPVGGDGTSGQNTDEIEEKIRDIVRKALSVDSAAKSAEKERRAARNAERRKEKSARGFRSGAVGRPSETHREGDGHHHGSSHRDSSSMVSNSINSIVSAIASNSSTAELGRSSRSPKTSAPSAATSAGQPVSTAVATFSGAGLVPVFPAEFHSVTIPDGLDSLLTAAVLQQPELSVSRGSSEDTESASETETTNDESAKDFSGLGKEEEAEIKVTSTRDSVERDEEKLVIDEPMECQSSSKLFASGSADKLPMSRVEIATPIRRPCSVPVISGDENREFSIAKLIEAAADAAGPPRVSSVPGIQTADISQPLVTTATFAPVASGPTGVSNFLGFTQSDVGCMSPSNSNNSLFGTNSAVNTSVADTLIASESRNSDSCGAGEYAKMEDEPEVFKVSSYLNEGPEESSDPFAYGETTAPVANESTCKGSSNTGNAGSPHEFSNPGNPEPNFTPAKEEIVEENLFKGSSNDGCAGNPHKHSNPGNPQVKEEVVSSDPAEDTVTASEETKELPDPPPSVKVEENVVETVGPPEAKVQSSAVVDVKQELPTNPTKEEIQVKKEKNLPIVMSQTVADLFGGEVNSAGLPKLQNFRIPRATKRPSGEGSLSSPKVLPSDIVGTHSPLTMLVAKQESGWNTGGNDKSNDSHRRRSGGGPPPKRYRSEFDEFNLKSPRLFGDRPKSCLTRDSLEKHSARSDLHTFHERGLMETLLEHKMRTGRVESHTKLVDRSFGNFQPTDQSSMDPPVVEPWEPSPEPSSSKQPRTPTKGPRTPPGTPPKCTPSPKQPALLSPNLQRSEKGKAQESPKQSGSEECPPAIAGLIDSLAKAAKVDSNELKKIFTNELIQKLQSLEPAVLMLTLTTLLTTMAQSSAEHRAAQSEVTADDTSDKPKESERKRHKNDSDSKEAAQRQAVTSSVVGSEDQQVTSTTAGVYENKMPVEMDIDDSDSQSSDSRQSSVTGRNVCVSSVSSERDWREKKPFGFDANLPVPPQMSQQQQFGPSYSGAELSEFSYYNPPAPVPPPQPVYNLKPRIDFSSELFSNPSDGGAMPPAFTALQLAPGNEFRPNLSDRQQPFLQQPQMFHQAFNVQNPALSLDGIIPTLPNAMGGNLAGLMDTPLNNPFHSGLQVQQQQPTVAAAMDPATRNVLAQLLGQAVRNLNVAVNNEIRSRAPAMEPVGMNFRPQIPSLRPQIRQPPPDFAYSYNQQRPMPRRDAYGPPAQDYYDQPHRDNFPSEPFGGDSQPPRFRRQPPPSQHEYPPPERCFQPRFNRPFNPRPAAPPRGHPQFYPRQQPFPRRLPPPDYQEYQEEYDWEEEESAGPYLPWEQPPPQPRPNYPARFQRGGYRQHSRY